MELSPSAISEFKEIFKSEFGVELSNSDARRKAASLLRYMNLIYKPISKTVGGVNE